MWYKLLKIIYVGLLIGISVILSILIHPIFYMVWVIYNRKIITLSLSIIIIILSILLPLQYYNLISSITHVDYWKLTSNPYIVYGLCLTLFFLPTRMFALKQINIKRRYVLAASIFILHLLWLWLPIIPLLLITSARYPVMQVAIMGAAAIIWDVMVTLLYVKYPDDILVTHGYQYFKSKFVGIGSR